MRQQKVFFSRLRKLRKNNKMKLVDLAKAIGISASYLSKIELGKVRIDYHLALNIALYFELKPDDIFLEDMLYNYCVNVNKHH